MVEAYRQLSEVTDPPLHLGVTEAGPPPAGLVKATAGIATLLLEGIGDTIRYSLTADPVEEARAGRQLLEALGSPRAQERRPHRLPELRSGRDRRDRRRQPGDGGVRRSQDPAPGGGDGLCGQRARRGRARPTSASPPATSAATCSSRVATSRWCPRTRWSTRSSSGPSSSTSTARMPRSPGSTPRWPNAKRPRTAPRCSTTRAPTRITPRRGSSRSAHRRRQVRYVTRGWLVPDGLVPPTPLHEFDPSLDAVINPSIHRRASTVPERAVMCWFGNVVRERTEGIEPVHHVPFEHGDHAICIVEHRGEQIALVSPASARPRRSRHSRS